MQEIFVIGQSRSRAGAGQHDEYDNQECSSRKIRHPAYSDLVGGGGLSDDGDSASIDRCHPRDDQADVGRNQNCEYSRSTSDFFSSQQQAVDEHVFEYHRDVFPAGFTKTQALASLCELELTEIASKDHHLYFSIMAR